jgi:PAS domain-containing protein
MAKAFEEAASSNVPGDGASIAALDRLCAIAAETCASEAAVIVYNRAGVTRVLASHGIESRFRTYEFDIRRAPFKPKQFVVETDAASDPKLRNMVAALGIPVCNFFLRAPVSITAQHATALIVASAHAVEPLTAAKIGLIKDIARLAHDELVELLPLLDDENHNVTALTTLAAMKQEVDGTGRMAALLDQDLRIRAVSKSLARQLGESRQGLIGMRQKEIDLRSSAAMTFFYRRALETGISPPELEVVEPIGRGRTRVYSVGVTPFSPTDTRDDFLYVTVRDVTTLSERERAIELRGRSRRQLPAKKPEPTLAFLLDTLVRRRVVRERKSVSYLTLMSWRHAIRSYQIAALKALKSNVPAQMGAAVGAQVAAEIRNMIGASAFKVVVPMPCSNSPSDSCLSLEIARGLAADLAIPLTQCLRLPAGGGSSHPKKNVRRPRLELIEKTAGPALLVDDVATSGAHIEEAVKLLRPVCGAVLAVAWISGAK